MELYYIESQYFTAGIKVNNNIVYAAAPIIHWMEGFTIDDVKNYCARKNFIIKKINEV